MSVALVETVMGLYKDGERDMPAQLIAEAHCNNGYTITVQTVRYRLPNVVRIFFDDHPQLSLHLSSEIYFDDEDHGFDLPPSQWIASVKNDDDENYARARTYLPMSSRSAGLRFVVGRNDYLSFVWAYHTNKSNWCKNQRQLHRDIVYLENKHWPREIGLYLLGQDFKSVVTGINNPVGLTPKTEKPLLSVRDQMAKVLQGWADNPFQTKEPPPKKKTQHHVRCPKCNAFLTSVDKCHRCGWKE
jgi:hypothetical protein